MTKSNEMENRSTLVRGYGGSGGGEEWLGRGKAGRGLWGDLDTLTKVVTLNGGTIGSGETVKRHSGSSHLLLVPPEHVLIIQAVV